MAFKTTDKTKRIGLVFLICTISTLFFFGQEYFSAVNFDKDFDPLRSFTFQALYSFVWGFLFLLIVPIANKFRLGKGVWVKNLPPHLLAGTIMALIHRAATLIPYIILFSLDKLDEISYINLFRKMVVGSFDSFATYWFILGAYYGIDYYKQYKDTKLEQAELQQQLAEANLQALKMQLHPHFLFNTLHAVSILMEENIQAARKMLVKLSELLRQTLDNTGVQFVSFREELEFLKNYLEIEQIRFEDKIKIIYEIEPFTLSANVPNLLLQPLVENAIKHGISAKTGAGEIKITAHKENYELILSVHDNGRGTNGEKLNNGIGLTNTRKRLQQLYDNSFKMDIVTQPDKGFTVTVSIPFIEFEGADDKTTN